MDCKSKSLAPIGGDQRIRGDGNSLFLGRSSCDLLGSIIVNI